MIVAVDLDEIRLFLAVEGRASGAVCFIADDQIEFGQARFLRAGQGDDGLIGRENDRHPFGIVFTRLFGDLGRIGGGRKRQIVDFDFSDIVGAFPALADMRVRADGKGADGRFRIVGPFPNRLRHQRQRRHHEQNALALARDGLGDLQRGEGFSGAAGHDHLAAICRAEALGDFSQGIALVRHQGLLGGENDLAPRLEDRPVDPAFAKVGQANAHDRDHLIPDHFLCVGAPFLLGRVENDAPAERLLARS